MAGITLAQAEAQLAVWLAANTAVAAKQSYTIEGRTLSYADAAMISAEVTKWDKLAKRLKRGGARVTQAAHR